VTRRALDVAKGLFELAAGARDGVDRAQLTHPPYVVLTAPTPRMRAYPSAAYPAFSSLQQPT
jgi:hypothetical protein